MSIPVGALLWGAAQCLGTAVFGSSVASAFLDALYLSTYLLLLYLGVQYGFFSTSLTLKTHVSISELGLS